MLYALSWFFITALLALWSLAVWALHAVSVWTVSHAGALTGAVSSVGAMPLPDVLAPWVPREWVQAMTALVSAAGPWIDSLLQAAPVLAGGLSVAAWVIWALGAGLLLVLGVGLHVVIALWRRRQGGGNRPDAGASLAPG